MGPRLRGDTRLCCPTLVEYPYASFASSQSCRTASMTRNSLPVSTCQKVQPLQLGAPCTPAPTLWIDPAGWPSQSRSEEHTSELQSLMRISYAVFCLKKKTATIIHILT